MIRDLGHTLLNILAKLFEINIEVSLDGCKPVRYHIFNHLALDSVHPLRGVHLIHQVDLGIQLIHLSLAGVES
jgi:hypothetical protein